MDKRRIIIKEICKINAESIGAKNTQKIINYLDTSSITKNKIEQIQQLDREKDKIPSRAQRKVRNETIIYSTVRPDQEHYGFIENPMENLIVSTGFLTIDVIDKKIFPKFLYYSLTQKHITDYLQTLASNNVSSYPSINVEDLANLVFEVPPLKTQQRIAAVLSALDAKIELNNRINKELEAMAKTIYDYWFVQFDFLCLPENYKFSGAGKPDNFEAVLTYRQVGGLPIPDGVSWFVYVILCDDGSFYKGMTKDLYYRFYQHYIGEGADWTKSHKPVKIIHYEKFHTKEEAAKREKELKTGFGRTWLTREYKACHHQTRLMMAGKMVWNEALKREIPVGWKVGKLGDMIDLNYGKGLKAEKRTGHGYPVIGSNGIVGYHSDFIVNTHGIVIGRKGTIGKITFVHGKFFPIDTTYYVKPKEQIDFYYLYFLLNSINLEKMNTDSAVPGLNRENALNIKIVIPPVKLIQCYEEIIKSSYEKIGNNMYENQTLASLRDFLLPMLMNGQVRV